jgi:hypothetical protein
MKLKRRTILYCLTSIYVLLRSQTQNSIQRARAQSSPAVGVNKNLPLALDLQQYQNNREQISTPNDLLKGQNNLR